MAITERSRQVRPLLTQEIYREIVNNPANINLIEEARVQYGDEQVVSAIHAGLREYQYGRGRHQNDVLEDLNSMDSTVLLKLVPPIRLATDDKGTLDWYIRRVKKGPEDVTSDVREAFRTATQRLGYRKVKHVTNK